jgi:3-oxoadipate enol-lactonase
VTRSLADVSGLKVSYELTGPPQAPVVVLSHSLGADLAMWDPQQKALARSFRVLRYDTRGHGGTALAAEPWTLAMLASDVVGLLDALGLARVHFCGLSMGGLVGMWLGAHAASRVDRLVLCSTGARIGTAESWNARIEGVRQGGMRSISSSVLERWFTQEFRRAAPEVVAGVRRVIETTPAQGYAACCAAIRDADERADLAAIRAPTLVISGRHDPATPPAEGQAVANAVPGARYVELPAAHLSNIEAAAAFNTELLGFLAGERAH